MDAVVTYLRDLRDIRASGSAVKETSYYPALTTLLNAIGDELRPRVRCVLTLKNRGAGIPDGGLFTADQIGKQAPSDAFPAPLPARGVIEVKGPRRRAPRRHPDRPAHRRYSPAGAGAGRELPGGGGGGARAVDCVVCDCPARGKRRWVVDLSGLANTW